MIKLITIERAADAKPARELFREYAAGLPVDLGFQNFDAELRDLPGQYSPPRGRLFVARVGSALAGCAALRPFAGNEGEVKRLYVRPSFRRGGIARLLVSAIVDAARSVPYQSLVLDTLEEMTPAISLYESFGFRRTEPYYANPLGGVAYFRLNLLPAGGK